MFFLLKKHSFLTFSFLHLLFPFLPQNSWVLNIIVCILSSGLAFLREDSTGRDVSPGSCLSTHSRQCALSSATPSYGDLISHFHFSSRRLLHLQLLNLNSVQTVIFYSHAKTNYKVKGFVFINPINLLLLIIQTAALKGIFLSSTS